MSFTAFYRPLICLVPAKSCAGFRKSQTKFKLFIDGASAKCSCMKNENTQKASESFSVLKTDIPCDGGSIWSTTALYIFSLHIPLSFGGLSMVSQVLHQPVLDMQTEALSILLIQTFELVGTLWLLNWAGKPQFKPLLFFEAHKSSKDRNWFLASALGLGFLMFLIFLTSFIADRLIGPKATNNPILKEILSRGSVSVTSCILAYCIITPLLEETVYRGFLLKSLASSMNWRQAVTLSSVVFSAAHLSGENFLQLFIIGFVLGCSYCWSGNLSSCIVIHSLYNAFTLWITFTS